MARTLSHKSEKKIQAEILKYLNSLPRCRAYDIITTSERGVPDILACYHGKFVAFEVKKPLERPKPLQLKQMERIRLAGGVAMPVVCVDDVQVILTLLVEKK
jgi:hypothetical protein